MIEGLTAAKKTDPPAELLYPTFAEGMEEGQIAASESMESQLLDQAEFFLQKEDYKSALNSLEKAITCCGRRFPDRTLHILAIVLAHPDNPMSDDNYPIRCFKWLESSFPDSVYGPASRCWVAVVNEFLVYETEIRNLRISIQSHLKEIRSLKRQIEQLKAVDLELQTPKPDDETQ
jgi:hypothetical protein